MILHLIAYSIILPAQDSTQGDTEVKKVFLLVQIESARESPYNRGCE